MTAFTYDEKISRFKDLANQYYGMRNQINGLREEIGRINDRMIGYRSPTWDKIGSAPTRHEPDIIGMIQAKMRYEKQIEEIEAKCAWVIRCINNMESPYDRTLANLLYLDGYSLSDVAAQYQISERYVFQTIKQAIGEAVSDELMYEYLALSGMEHDVIG